MPVGDLLEQLTGNEELKLDLYGGETQFAIFNGNRTRVTRRGIVRNLPNTSAKNLLATCVVFQDAGTFHPDLPELLIHAIRSVSFGPQKTMVEAEYRPNPLTFGGLSPVAGASFRTAYESFTVYKSSVNAADPSVEVYDPNTGLPDGDMLEGVEEDTGLHDPSRPPRPTRWRRPVLRVVVRTELSFNVLTFPGVAPSMGKVNSNQFVFNNGSGLPGDFGPQRVRFDGVDVQVVENQLGIPTFQTSYVFSVVAFGTWHEHTLRPFVGPLVGWEVETVPMYDSAAFPQFPI